ncbi:hypothetical protein ACFE04_002906 [Oxalis oulophora]
MSLLNVSSVSEVTPQYVSQKQTLNSQLVLLKRENATQTFDIIDMHRQIVVLESAKLKLTKSLQREVTKKRCTVIPHCSFLKAKNSIQASELARMHNQITDLMKEKENLVQSSKSRIDELTTSLEESIKREMKAASENLRSIRRLLNSHIS